MTSNRRQETSIMGYELCGYGGGGKEKYGDTKPSDIGILRY